MEMKCPCGGKLLDCTLNTGIASVQSVTVPNGYNFPKPYQVKAYICESCGKIELYAVKSDNKTNI